MHVATTPGSACTTIDRLLTQPKSLYMHTCLVFDVYRNGVPLLPGRSIRDNTGRHLREQSNDRERSPSLHPSRGHAIHESFVAFVIDLLNALVQGHGPELRVHGIVVTSDNVVSVVLVCAVRSHQLPAFQIVFQQTIHPPLEQKLLLASDWSKKEKKEKMSEPVRTR